MKAFIEQAVKGCTKCGEVKPLAEFCKNKNRRDGLALYCRKCMSILSRKWRKENPDKRKRYAQEYNNRPYARAKRYEGIAQYRKKYPERTKAIKGRSNALVRGKIIKPETCVICNSIAKLDAHHEDYSKPLDVVWLCRSCHVKYHKGVTKEADLTRSYVKKYCRGLIKKGDEPHER